MRNNFEDVNKSAKSIVFNPYELETVVFVNVRIDNLKAFSKSKLSNSNKPDKINKHIKKEINI